jgi:cytochrome P450
VTNAKVDASSVDPHPDASQGPAKFSEPAVGEGWVASRYEDVQKVLADDHFEVLAVLDTGAVGTISWLRASVSRFVNGAEHERRRADLVEQLQLLDPDELRRAAGQGTRAALTSSRSGDRIDVMAGLARRVPMASMARSFETADPEDAAKAVTVTAAGYFPGSAPEAQRAADAATARLVGIFAPAGLDVAVARISLMVQACDATAALIGRALHVLQDGPDAATDWPTDALLAEVLRHSPPNRAIRRVARQPIELGGCRVSVGDAVTCNIEAANRDPAVFERPAHFDPTRDSRPVLTFGYGLRPCPGQLQALALAAGVVDTIRQLCTLLPGEPVDYGPSGALRIPQQLDVVLR